MNVGSHYKGLGARLLQLSLAGLLAYLMIRDVSPAELGRYGVAFSIVSLWSVLCGFELPIQVARSASTKEARAFARSTRISCWVALGGAMAICLFLVLRGSDLFLPVLMLGPATFFRPVVSNGIGQLAQDLRENRLHVVQTAPAAVRTACVVALVLAERSPTATELCAIESIATVVTLVVLPRSRRTNRDRIDQISYRRFVSQGAGLTLLSMSVFATQRLDLIGLGLVDRSTAGTYSAVLRISEMALVLSSGLTVLLLPMMARSAAEGRSTAYWRAARLTTLLVSCVLGPLASSGNQLIEWISDSPRTVSSTGLVLVCVSISVFVALGPTEGVVQAARDERASMWISLTVMVGMSTSVALLTPSLLFNGAALASILGYVLLRSAHLAFLVRRGRLLPQPASMAGNLLLCTTAIAGSTVAVHLLGGPTVPATPVPFGAAVGPLLSLLVFLLLERRSNQKALRGKGERDC